MWTESASTLGGKVSGALRIYIKWNKMHQFKTNIHLNVKEFESFFLDLDMKKDIDALIAEERTEIIAKYDRVSVWHTSSISCFYNKYQ